MLAGNKAAKPDDETSAVPAWRTAIVHAVGMNLAGIMSIDEFRELAPGMGTYGNEVCANLAHYVRRN